MWALGTSVSGVAFGASFALETAFSRLKCSRAGCAVQALRANRDGLALPAGFCFWAVEAFADYVDIPVAVGADVARGTLARKQVVELLHALGEFHQGGDLSQR